MRAMLRRVTKLEEGMPEPACAACGGDVRFGGKSIGVVFERPGVGDYEPRSIGHGQPPPTPPPPPPPPPPQCPGCGRRMPKVYVMESRASWDAMVGGRCDEA